MEELERLYDTIKDYRQGCVVIFIEPVEKHENGFYIVDRCVDNIQKNQHDIQFKQITNNIYYSYTESYLLQGWLETNYSENKYILIDIRHIHTN
jgi:hypothetical protein